MMTAKRTRKNVLLFVAALVTMLGFLLGAPKLAFAQQATDACPNPGTAHSTPFTDTDTTEGDNVTNTISEVPLDCNGRHQQVAGRDKFYALQVGANNNFTVTVTPNNTQYDVSIYLVRASDNVCNPTTCTTGLGIDDGLAGVPETLTVSGLAPGLYYLGIDSFFNTADARSAGPYTITVTGQIGAIPTTTTVTSSAQPASVNQPLQWTATVNAQNGTSPTGAVFWSIDGSTPVGSGLFPTAGASQSVFSPPSPLTAGQHTILATYVANGDYSGSEGTFAQQVDPGPSATTISSSPNPSTFGQTVLFTVNVSSPYTPPTGNVTVTIGGGGGTTQQLALNNGTATLQLSTLTVGSHTVHASYAGVEGVIAPSSSGESAPNQVVNLGPTTTTVTSSHNGSSPSFGTAITFTATISPTGATGSVSWSVNGNPAGTTDVANGVATLVLSDLAVGPNTITAVYSGDSSYATSTGTTSQSISPVGTSLAIAADPGSPSSAGTPVTFTATVTAPGDTPGGAIVFTVDGTDRPQITLEGGTASITEPLLTPGAHTVGARYVPDATHSETTASLSHVVSRVSSTVSVTVQPNTAVYLQPVILHATVGPVTSPYGSGPTGTVAFADGATALGTATVSNGEAQIPALLLPGSHSITATYSGDTVFSNATSAPASLTVSKAATTTALVSSTNPSIQNDPVTFTAHVAVTAPGNGIPDGTIQFNDGATILATVTVDANGDARLTTSSLALGAHTITATYSGSTGYEGSSSQQVVQQVSSTGARMTIVSSSNPAPRGTNITFTATVEAVGIAQSPTGTVTFTADGNPIGTSPVAADHTASVSLATLGGGTHTIRATYSGDGTFQQVTSELLQHISPAAVQVQITSSLNPSDPGQEVTFTVTVTSQVAGAITGTIVFRDGLTSLGVVPLTSGTATFKTSSLTSGNHAIGALYSGDTNYAPGASNTVQQVVTGVPEPPQDGGGAPDTGSSSGGNPDGGGGGGGGSNDSGVRDGGGIPPVPGLDAGNIPLNFNPGSPESCDCNAVGTNSHNSLAGVLVAVGLALAAARRRKK